MGLADGGRGGPGPLGPPTFAGVAEAAEGAWWEELRRWVGQLRADYWHLWPDPPAGDELRRRRAAWPSCWREHPGLVRNLVVLRTWHDGLCEGMEWAGGVQGWHEWDVFLRRIAADVQEVVQLCTPQHRAVPWARQEATTGRRQ